METTTWILIALIATAAFLYDYWKRSYFKRKGIPCAYPIPFIGHYHQMILKGFVKAIAELGRGPEKIEGLFLGTAPTIVVNDADMIKEIMVRSFSHFYNRPDQPIEDYPLNKGLNQLKGSRWKQVRNTITPAFSANKMKPIAALLNDSCDSMIKNLKKAIASNPDIEVKAMFGDLTMDCIAKAGFGVQADTQENPNNPFVENAKSFTNVSFSNPVLLISVFIPQLAPVLNYFRIGILPLRSKQFFLEVTKKAMELRQDQGSKRFDILQLMVDAHMTGEGNDVASDIPELAGEEKSASHKTELTDGELMAQSVLFFFAGYETTNIALSFVSYHLATHPDLQDRLFEEVQEMAPDRESVNYDTVSKMEYLDMFLSETLRLYPPGVAADRICQEPITINGYQFDKEVPVFINIIGVHHDPDYWSDPEKFDPERFTKEAKEKRHPYAYIPFGTGPRNCIGMRFALLVLKMAIVRVVQNFKFEPCEKTQIPIQYGMSTVTPEKGITLRIIARE